MGSKGLKKSQVSLKLQVSACIQHLEEIPHLGACKDSYVSLAELFPQSKMDATMTV